MTVMDDDGSDVENDCKDDTDIDARDDVMLII